MLSVNYIATFLDKEQKNVKEDSYCSLKKFEYNNEYNELIKNKIQSENKKKADSYINLYSCFDKFFEEKSFGINKDKSKNRNNIYTFFSAIFGIGNESYYLMNDQEQIVCIKNLIKKMDDELFVRNLYKEFNYDKNKYFNKEKIMKSLKDSFRLNIDENFDLVKKYIADYLGINIVFFEIKNENIVDKYIISSNKYTEEHNKYLPYYFIIKEEDTYIPIMMKEKENTNYITFDEIYNISEMLPEFEEIKIRVSNSKNINDYKKMKVDELREYCINNNINIHKISEKTGKEIKKTKDELINEIVK
tara:strand:- start:8302 stop:9213 length:912 start_codon:yes stop_codon:yes gene_type:complete